MAKRRRGLARRILRGMLLAAAAWLGVTIAVVLAFRWVDPPFTMFMLSDRIGAVLTREQAYDFSHDWVAWERISKQAALAVIAAEDQQFPNHGGFDFKQIDKALADRERGRRVRGASTISQQVAKNIFLWRGQSWFRKGLEAGITVLIEAFWPKQRILEVYLNIAEFGQGTYGVQAASQRFFDKDAAKLNQSEAAPLAAQLTVFQRSANWLMPRKDRLYAPRTQRLLTRLPALAKLYHDAQWFFFGEMQLTPLMKQVKPVQALARWKSLAHLRRQVKDPALRAKLVPDFPIGAKRVLFNDDYYPALSRSNVALVTGGIERIETEGVRSSSGVLHAADVIIYATGFKSTDFLAPMTITGRGGLDLKSEWARGARAYLGITVTGFPNFFMLYGPNTNLGHNSILVMIEAQVGYILDALDKLKARGLRRIDVRREVLEAYNRDLQHDLAKSVWATTGASWYKLADGTITNAKWKAKSYFKGLLREARLEDYDTD